MYIRREPLLLRIIDIFYTIILVNVLSIRFIICHIAMHIQRCIGVLKNTVTDIILLHVYNIVQILICIYIYIV